MNRKYYILCLLLFYAGILFAQNERFTASVSKTVIGTGEQFEITFSTNSNGDRFTPPDFTGFQVLSGPNISQSVSSINGVTTMQNAYSYVLTPVKEGILVIGSATMVINGHKLSSNIIRVEAVRGRQPQQNGLDPNLKASDFADLSKSLFIRAVVDKSNVYEGEQIILSYRLFTRIGIDQSALEKLPDLNGFWNQDIKNAQQQAQWHIETYKGQKYNATDIKQTILFPEHTGNITIDPMAMVFLVRQPVASNDPFDQFFGNNYKQVKFSAKSQPLVIRVRPLSEKDKPAGFTGAVGTFKVAAAVDKTTLKANETFNYTVKVMGSGNIKLLKALNVIFPADFERYDPKITDTTTETAKGVSGTRIYSYLVIPRHQGDYTIDPLKFSYFNPTTNKYTTVDVKSFRIKVNKGLTEKTVSSVSNQSEVKTLGKDIRYIKTTNPGLIQSGKLFFGSLTYYLLLLLGPVCCIAAFQYRNWMIRKNSDIVQVKSRRAGKEAARHLASAHVQLKANNSNLFYEDVFRGLYGYLGNKLNIPSANLNRETIATALKERMIDVPLITQLLETLDLCEMARYAPVTHISMQQVFDRAQTIINDIESKIK